MVAGRGFGARSALGAAALIGAVKGTAIECAWTATHLALYPMGALRQLEGRAAAGSWERRFSMAGLSPAQRGLLADDVEAAGTPILLVHGMIDNRSIFTMLRRGLGRRGFGQVSAMNYSPFTVDVRAAAHEFAHRVEALCADTGYERIHVVGHSLGGLIARYYVQRLGGDERVHTLVTLGTPHEGTLAASLVPHPVATALRPGSELLCELAAPVARCHTRFLAFWSDLDQLIWPRGNARLTHPDLNVRNHLVRGVGHLSLPIHRAVVHEICAALAHLDSRGDTITAGVTSLAASSSSAVAGATEAAPRRSRRGAAPSVRRAGPAR